MNCSVEENILKNNKYLKIDQMEKKTNYTAPVFPETVGQFSVSKAVFDSLYEKKLAAKASNTAETSYTLGMVNLTEVSFGSGKNNLYIKNGANILIPYGEYQREDDGSLVAPQIELPCKVNLSAIMSYLLDEKNNGKNYLYLLIEEIVEPNGSHMLNLVYGRPSSAHGVPVQYSIASKRGRELPSAQDLAKFEQTLTSGINRHTIYHQVSP
jgi:hypothetical protein